MNKIKELQNLYSWRDFYRMNNRIDDYNKTLKQIKDFKFKNNLK